MYTLYTLTLTVIPLSPSALTLSCHPTVTPYPLTLQSSHCRLLTPSLSPSRPFTLSCYSTVTPHPLTLSSHSTVPLTPSVSPSHHFAITRPLPHYHLLTSFLCCSLFPPSLLLFIVSIYYFVVTCAQCSHCFTDLCGGRHDPMSSPLTLFIFPFLFFFCLLSLSYSPFSSRSQRKLWSLGHPLLPLLLLCGAAEERMVNGGYV